MSVESPLCNIVKVEKISTSNKSVDRTYSLDITCKVSYILSDFFSFVTTYLD